MNKTSNESVAVVHIATYPPRECGIATFSRDLIENIDKLFVFYDDAKVVAMNSPLLSKYKYSKKVIFEISENEKEDYEKVANELNKMKDLKLVSIQHEFGIFGKNFGENIIFFLKKIEKPVVITMHTVLPDPPEEMKKIVQTILDTVGKVIVMTKASKQLLLNIYSVNEEKIGIIPHGIHPLPYTKPGFGKEKYGLSGKKVLATFGLLGRGKGVEQGILALKEIVKKIPEVVYLIIGATHPVVLKNEGESYRESLQSLIKENNLEKNVIFYNKYFETAELLSLLQATDIYLSLSQNLNQAVSGTLSYALGAGRPVIATPFMQAKEIVTEEVGKLVDFNNTHDLASNVISFFSDEARLENMGKAAYFRTRGMIWPNIALSYMKEFTNISPELGHKEKNIPSINLSHLKKLTDDFGILQFAVLDQPDMKWGHTLDDNARALVALSWFNDRSDENVIHSLAETYLSFLEKAAKKEKGFFNYMNQERDFSSPRNIEENLEDANARAMWALAEAAQGKLPDDIKKRAEKLFERELKDHANVFSPRANSFYIKAFSIWSKIRNNEEAKKMITKYADFLVSLFRDNKSSEWAWFEPILSYSNALLPEALFEAYRVTSNDLYLDIAKQSLDFLINHSFKDGVCVPVGQSGWFKKGGIKKLHDQQPEEVSALVIALKKAYEVTKDERYLDKIYQAFNWFLGNNLLNQVVYSFDTGGCFDGLGEDKINLNQGAESTISYLLARLAIDSSK